ncbi:MAG: FHA domain-containing protein, partial [Myxococcota bacterium]
MNLEFEESQRPESTLVVQPPSFAPRYAWDDPEIAGQHRLRIQDPTGDRWEYPVLSELTIGRAEDNHITLQDRAVSRHHLAINTDGKLFWYQDLNSGNGTQVNGELMVEGWLTGGEEILVGNSVLHFMAPAIDIPEGLEAEGAAPQQTESQPPPPSKSQRIRKFGLFLVLLTGIAFAGHLAYQKWFVPQDTQTLSLSEKTLQIFQKAKSAFHKEEWEEAQKLFFSAAKLSKGLPIHAEIRKYLPLARKEWTAWKMLQDARTLYLDKDKVKEALQLLEEIPPDTKTFPRAQHLKDKIYAKEILPRLRNARLALRAKRYKQAQKNMLHIFEIAPKHPGIQKLKAQINTYLSKLRRRRRAYALKQMRKQEMKIIAE